MDSYFYLIIGIAVRASQILQWRLAYLAEILEDHLTNLRKSLENFKGVFRGFNISLKCFAKKYQTFSPQTAFVAEK